MHIRKWRLELTLVALVALTIVALLGEKTILQSTLVITPEDPYVIEVLDDVVVGGDSSAKALDAHGFEWECTLGNKISYPFCEMDLLLTGNPIRGVDLRNFTALRVWLDYDGPGKTVRIYLRNFDPVYSRAKDAASTKFNQVEVATESLRGGPVEVSLRDFFVANWWITSNAIPPKLSHPQFDNIVVMEIQTGTADTTGTHRFKLNRVELAGQAISTEQWYLLILSFWLLAVIGFLAFRVASLHREARAQRARANELVEVNMLLDRRTRELEEMSKVDHLTGALNRQGVEESLQIGLGEWRREGKPLSLVLMDIDRFKQINDRFGHTYGDYVLSEVSQLVKGYVRPQDLFARWGGEEFVLVCRNTRLEDARVAADQLRTLIAQHGFEGGVRVTSSFGVATLRDTETLEHLFHVADQALYRAKAEGRNRVATMHLESFLVQSVA